MVFNQKAPSSGQQPLDSPELSGLYPCNIPDQHSIHSFGKTWSSPDDVYLLLMEESNNEFPFYNGNREIADNNSMKGCPFNIPHFLPSEPTVLTNEDNNLSPCSVQQFNLPHSRSPSTTINNIMPIPVGQPSSLYATTTQSFLSSPLPSPVPLSPPISSPSSSTSSSALSLSPLTSSTPSMTNIVNDMIPISMNDNNMTNEICTSPNKGSFNMNSIIDNYNNTDSDSSSNSNSNSIFSTCYNTDYNNNTCDASPHRSNRLPEFRLSFGSRQMMNGTPDNPLLHKDITMQDDCDDHHLYHILRDVQLSHCDFEDDMGMIRSLLTNRTDMDKDTFPLSGLRDYDTDCSEEDIHTLHLAPPTSTDFLYPVCEVTEDRISPSLASNQTQSSPISNEFNNSPEWTESNLPTTVIEFKDRQASPTESEKQRQTKRSPSSPLRLKRKSADSPICNERERKKPGRKPGQVSNVLHLWEFMRDLLHDPKTSERIIQWVSKPDGVFRVVDSSEVARLWGQKKNNKKEMTYEKLSRSLRYSRLEGYFDSLPKDKNYPKKLCFKFGPKSHHLSTIGGSTGMNK